MNDLSILRNNWDAHAGDGDSPLEATTLQERLHQWIEPQAALIELQTRLQQLSNP